MGLSLFFIHAIINCKKKKILSLWAPFSHRHENSTNKSRYFINYDSHTTEKQEEYDEGKKKVYKNSYYIPLKTQQILTCRHSLLLLPQHLFQLFSP